MTPRGLDYRLTLLLRFELEEKLMKALDLMPLAVYMRKLLRVVFAVLLLCGMPDGV